MLNLRQFVEDKKKRSTTMTDQRLYLIIWIHFFGIWLAALSVALGNGGLEGLILIRRYQECDLVMVTAVEGPLQ